MVAPVGVVFTAFVVGANIAVVAVGWRAAVAQAVDAAVVLRALEAVVAWSRRCGMPTSSFGIAGIRRAGVAVVAGR